MSLISVVCGLGDQDAEVEWSGNGISQRVPEVSGIQDWRGPQLAGKWLWMPVTTI